MRQLPDFTGADVGGVDLGFAERMLRIGDAIRGEGDPLAIGREAGAAVIPLTVGDLARRASVGGNQEDVPQSVVGETDAVRAEVQLGDDLRRLGPLGALGRRRHRDSPVRHHGHAHVEGNRFAVGRPLEIRWRLSEVRDLGGRSLGVHPAHPDLRTARLALRDVRDALAVRRPAYVGPLDERARVRAVRVHHPEGRFPPVVHLVDPPPSKDYLCGIRRKLRALNILPVEILFEGDAVYRLLLRRHGRHSPDGDEAEYQLG